MGKKGRHTNAGRVTSMRNRPLAFAPRHHGAFGWRDPEAEPEPGFLRVLQHVLAAEHPLALLGFASSMLAGAGGLGRNPFDRWPDEAIGPSWDDLLRVFMEDDRPETSALLAALALLGTDEVERRRIGRALERRGDPGPAWLAEPGPAPSYRAVLQSHLLGDSEKILLGVGFPTGDDLCAVISVDHNLGTVVTDAQLLPLSIGHLASLLRPATRFGDIELTDLSPADARARLAEALERGARRFPPFETDSWPACRPLVEWIVRLLPEGGRGYRRRRWTEKDRRLLVDRFFASAVAAGLDDDDHRGLLEVIVWLVTDAAPGDPLRWSPLAVEILLTLWLPRRILAPVDYLAGAPELLRAFVQFCHAERRVPRGITAETLEAIDRCEPGYQAAIRSPRMHHPGTLVAAAGELVPAEAWGNDDADGRSWYRSSVLGPLERAVGGADLLDELDDTPLPDEAFDWAGIPAEIHDDVAAVLERCDECCDRFFDVEARTAVRRMLARIARRGPQAIKDRGRGRADLTAVAICWTVGRANDLFSQRRGGLTQKTVLAHFGLRGGIADRARTLLHAGGFQELWGEVSLGSPDYLVSRRRRAILGQYRRYLAASERAP